MNKPLLLLILVLCATISFASGINKPVTSQYGFIENKGQIIDQNNNLNPSVLYLYNGNSLHVQLKQNGFSYEVWKIAAGPQPIATSQSPLPEANSQKPTADSNYIHRIDISFVDANPNAKITASEPASDYINYYTTGTSEKGATNVHHYKKVLYQNIYNNIDVEFCLSDGSSSPSGSPPAGQEGLGGASFKYNFIVRPGGNVNDIQLQFDGANSTSLTSDGHITIETAYGNIDESIPSTYQINNDNAKQSIKSNFKQQTSNTFDIEVSNYDKTKTLIIDPTPWGTYFGGTSGDLGYGITTDILRDMKKHTSKQIVKAIEENNSDSKRELFLNQFYTAAKNSNRHKKHCFWQEANYPVELYSDKFIIQKETYIHMNPVKAGIVSKPEYYRLSSASDESPIKILPWK